MDEPTTKEALQGIEQTCEWDEKCRNTAVTFQDDIPVCDYHSGVLLTGENEE